jgi:hypothetical protein
MSEKLEKGYKGGYVGGSSNPPSSAPATKRPSGGGTGITVKSEKPEKQPNDR